MRLRPRLLVVSTLLVAAGIGGVAGCGGGASEDEQDRAVAAAEQAYADAKREGVDFSAGPCLGIVMENWVADVAHDPREDVDDEPENQCEAYRSGKADHFVELDPDGNLIRAE